LQSPLSLSAGSQTAAQASFACKYLGAVVENVDDPTVTMKQHSGRADLAFEYLLPKEIFSPNKSGTIWMCMLSESSKGPRHQVLAIMMAG
jgi:hypothetical protein